MNVEKAQERAKLDRKLEAINRRYEPYGVKVVGILWFNGMPYLLDNDHKDSMGVIP